MMIEDTRPAMERLRNLWLDWQNLKAPKLQQPNDAIENWMLALARLAYAAGWFAGVAYVQIVKAREKGSK